MGGARVICASCLGALVKILPSAQDFIGVFPFADVFRAPVHRKRPHVSNIVLDHRVGPQLSCVIAVPVHDLFESPSITPADILFRITDRNSPDPAREWCKSWPATTLLAVLLPPASPH